MLFIYSTMRLGTFHRFTTIAEHAESSGPCLKEKNNELEVFYTQRVSSELIAV